MSSLRHASVALEDLLAESSDDEDQPRPPQPAADTASSSSSGEPIPSKHAQTAKAAQRLTALQDILRDESDDDDSGPLRLPPLPLQRPSVSSAAGPPTTTTGQAAAPVTRVPLSSTPPTSAAGAAPAASLQSSPARDRAATTGPAPSSNPQAAVLTRAPSASISTAATPAFSQSLKQILHDPESDDEEDLPAVPVRRGSKSIAPSTAAAVPVAASAPVAAPTPIQPRAVFNNPAPAAPAPAAAPAISAQPPPTLTTPTIIVPPSTSPASSSVAKSYTAGSSDDSEDDDAALPRSSSKISGTGGANPINMVAAAAAILNNDSSDDDTELIAKAQAQTRQPLAHTRAPTAQAQAPAIAPAPVVAQPPQMMTEQDLALIPDPLTRAEVLERHLATLGNVAIINPLAAAKKNAPSAARPSSSTTPSSPATSNLVDLLSLDRLSKELDRLRPSIGLATTCCLHSKLFGVGTSRGIVVIFDHFEAVMMMLGKVEDVRQRGAITCIDMNAAGDQLLVGYSKGAICVWDIHNKSIIKVISDVTTQPICAIRFTKQEAGNKNWTFMACDTSGCLNLFVLTKQLFSYGLDKQVLLQGKAGPVLSSAVLNVNPAFQHPADSFSLVAISNEAVTSIISLEPQVQIVFRMAREANERVGVVPVLAWRGLQARDVMLNDPAALQAHQDTISAVEVEVAKHPVLAVARGRTLTLLQVVPIPDRAEVAALGAKIPLKFNTLHVQTFPKEIKSVNWLGHGSALLIILAPNDEMLLLDPFTLPLAPLVTVDGRSIGIVHSEFFSHPVTGAPELSFTPSISATDAALLLLGSDKVSELRVLPWHERLDSLILNTDDPQWILCLSLALEFYHGTAKLPAGLPRDRVAVQQRLRDKMIELIGNFIHVMLQVKGDGSNGSSGSSSNGSNAVDLLTGGHTVQKTDRHYMRILGGTCIAYCISINRLDVLFGDIAEKFRLHFPFQFGGSGTPVSIGTELFLELLEPYILLDQLTTVPVHILTDFFALYHYKKRLPQLEQMLLHLNPLSLDLNFLIPQIKTYRLFSACIYMYSQ
jgi:hypothetical protein